MKYVNAPNSAHAHSAYHTSFSTAMLVGAKSSLAAKITLLDAFHAVQHSENILFIFIRFIFWKTTLRNEHIVFIFTFKEVQTDTPE